MAQSHIMNHVTLEMSPIVSCHVILGECVVSQSDDAFGNLVTFELSMFLECRSSRVSQSEAMKFGQWEQTKKKTRNQPLHVLHYGHDSIHAAGSGADQA